MVNHAEFVEVETPTLFRRTSEVITISLLEGDCGIYRRSCGSPVVS